MKAYILLSTIIILSTVSCTRNNSKSENSEEFTYSIKLTNKPKACKFNNLIKDFNVVKLETNHECLLGTIERSEVINDQIYLLDNFGVNSFDLTGEHIFSIKKRGRGPGEFLKIVDMNVYDGVLYIYDQNLHKIILYNSQSGVFIKEIKTPINARSLKIVDDKIFFDRSSLETPLLNKSDDSRFLMTSINKQSKLLYKGGEVKNDYNNIGTSDRLQISNSQIFFKHSILQKIQKYENGRLIPYIRFVDNLGVISDDMKYENYKTPKKNNTLILELSDFCENNNFWIASFLLTRTPYNAYLIFDKKTLKYKYFHSITSNSANEIPPYTFDGLYRDYCYSIVQSSDILYHLSLYNDSIRIKELENIGIEDNPCLFFYTLKPIK